MFKRIYRFLSTILHTFQVVAQNDVSIPHQKKKKTKNQKQQQIKGEKKQQKPRSHECFQV